MKDILAMTSGKHSGVTANRRREELQGSLATISTTMRRGPRWGAKQEQVYAEGEARAGPCKTRVSRESEAEVTHARLSFGFWSGI